MYDDIFQFEPLYPAKTDELEDIAREEVVTASSRLDGSSIWIKISLLSSHPD
jgi:hypothetical protein